MGSRTGSNGPADICMDGECVFREVPSPVLVDMKEITNHTQADGVDSDDRICWTIDDLWAQSIANVARLECRDSVAALVVNKVVRAAGGVTLRHAFLNLAYQAALATVAHRHRHEEELFRRFSGWWRSIPAACCCGYR